MRTEPSDAAAIAARCALLGAMAGSFASIVPPVGHANNPRNCQICHGPGVSKLGPSRNARLKTRIRAKGWGFGTLERVTSSTDRLPKVSGAAAVSLAAMQVDVTTHLGAVGPATSTGLPGLDALMGGGLRSGTLLALSGPAGSGRTSVALSLAYLAARA